MSRAEATRTVGWLRRRMPRHIFSTLFLLSLLLGCGPAYAGDEAPARRVKLFSAGTTKVPDKVGDTSSARRGRYFVRPFLVAGGGLMAVLAEARYARAHFRGVDIVARHIDTEGANWADKTTANNGENWGTQLVLPGKEKGKYHKTMKRPVAVIKGDKTYLLAVIDEGNGADSLFHNRWYLELVVGEIVGGTANKTIEWNQSESLGSALTLEIENKGLRVFPARSHSAFLTSKGTIVFSVGVTNKEGKQGYAIMQMKDDKEQWEVSFIDNSKWCRFFSLFEWKERLIAIVTGCWDGDHHVREYDEVSKEWNDFNETLFRPGQEFSKTRGFTTASIENKTVLLYTEVRFNNSAIGQWRIRLWVTDGRRFHDVGVIAAEYAKVVSWGLLYTNGELFSLHDGTAEWLKPIVFTRLDRQLKVIRSKVKSWNKKDAYLSGSSPSPKRGILYSRW